MAELARLSKWRYWRIWLSFARNSLQRDMSFRTNFIINATTEFLWFAVMVVFFKVIYQRTADINGWNESEYFAFMATSMIINGVIEMFFMSNCMQFGENIRTGNLDFALLKPMDTQFLVSLQQIDWSVLASTLSGVALLLYSLARLEIGVGLGDVALYTALLGAGVAVFYSIMLVVTSASVWMGRNQSLHEFWFYVTVFAGYPRSVYRGPLGTPLYGLLCYGLPILLVVSVPAEALANRQEFLWHLAGVLVIGAAACLAGSRWVFRRAIDGYRSASS